MEVPSVLCGGDVIYYVSSSFCFVAFRCVDTSLALSLLRQSVCAAKLHLVEYIKSLPWIIVLIRIVLILDYICVRRFFFRITSSIKINASRAFKLLTQARQRTFGQFT